MASSNLGQVCSEGDLTQIKEILDCNPNTSQAELDKALSCAAEAGHDVAAGLLLSRGAHLTRGAIYGAVGNHNTAMFQQFLDHGWDINSRVFRSPTLFSVLRDVACTKWFLEHGADPNLPSGGRNDPSSVCCTPLASAAVCSSTTVIELLLSYGAELDPKALYNAIGCRPSYGGGGLSIMKVLLDRGMDPNAPSHNHGVPLCLAIQMGIKERVQLLLERGADRTRMVYGKTLLEIAESKGNREICEMLSG